MSAALFVIGSLAVQWLLCGVASPWWVPDVTLVAVMLVIASAPDGWWLPSAIAGLLTMGWMIQAPALPLVWYLALGLGVSLGSGFWDLGDRRIQLVAIGIAEGVWLSLHVWFQDVAVLPLAGWLLLHVGITLLSVPMMRRLVPQMTQRNYG
jgi:hypothetical protein